MNADVVAALDAALAALERYGQEMEQANTREREGERARRYAATNPELLALLTPGRRRGEFLGPWVTLTCPAGHHIAPVRAVVWGDGEDGSAQLRAGAKHAHRTRRETFREGTAIPGVGQSVAARPWPAQTQTEKLHGRRVWECPQPGCAWAAPVGEAFLWRLYTEAATRRLRRAPLARPS